MLLRARLGVRGRKTRIIGDRTSQQRLVLGRQFWYLVFGGARIGSVNVPPESIMYLREKRVSVRCVIPMKNDDCRNAHIRTN